MNFEDLQKAWQAQDTAAKVTINTDLLMKEVRRNQRKFQATIFWRDAREVGAAMFGAWIFLRWGLRDHDWAFILVAFGSFFVGAFILVDRLIQHQRRPVLNNTLHACVQSSLNQVNHQIWLLKNVLWWYVLPIAVALAISFFHSAWQDRHEGWTAWFGFALMLLVSILVDWGVYRLNQFAVRKSLEPRRRELESLLAEIGNIPPIVATQNKSMKTTIILAILLLAALAIGVVCAAVPSTPSGIKPPSSSGGKDQSLAAICQKYELPAIAVVVVKDGQICDRGAAGVRKWGDPTPVTTNDVFHIGSCTKSMTATLTGMLIDSGKLRWDTTIAEVFPELKGKMDPQYEAVTVEQLLHHRGGVPADPPSAAWKQAWKEQGTPTRQRREFIEAVLAEPPAATPGTKMIYSNQGYAIIGAMLEKITGQDYESLITEKLFKPLHMDTAGFGPPGTKDQVDQPWGHVHKLFMTIPLQVDNPPAIASAGRVHCSLDDLARYAIFHLQGATNGLLKPETLARLHTAPTASDSDDPLDRYACGWVILQRGWAGGTTLWHNGSNTMWYIVMWLAPNKDFAVIAATNIAGDGAEQGCDDACVTMIHKWLPQ